MNIEILQTLKNSANIFHSYNTCYFLAIKILDSYNLGKLLKSTGHNNSYEVYDMGIIVYTETNVIYTKNNFGKSIPELEYGDAYLLFPLNDDYKMFIYETTNIDKDIDKDIGKIIYDELK